MGICLAMSYLLVNPRFTEDSEGITEAIKLLDLEMGHLCEVSACPDSWRMSKLSCTRVRR